MPLEFKDRVTDASTTVGTGTLTLTGAAPTGFRSFAAAGFTTGATVRYSITSADLTQWEVGQGVWTSSGSTLTRTTVYASSNANALVSFSAGTKSVSCVNTAADVSRQNTCQVQMATLSNTTTAGFQKVPFNSIMFDTGEIWDAVNNRFNPKKAGVYAVSANIRMSAAGGVSAGAVYKNGAFYAAIGHDTADIGFGFGSPLVEVNGTTDYIEIFAFSLNVRAYDTASSFANVIGPL